MSKSQYVEAMGWVGVVLILSAFTLNIFGILGVESIWYTLMNLCGAAGVVVSSLPKRNWQPVVINVVWFFVAAIGIIKALA